MTTTINANTFIGPNQGSAEGYIPDTTIESAKVDADLNQILTDLDSHLALLQAAFTKLDQIDLTELGAIEAVDVVPVINASNLKIDANNLADSVVLEDELTATIDAHKNATSSSAMHPETSIKSTELTYSNTPSALLTNCTNLLDELKNLRYQIHRINGKTNWSDTPDASITSLQTSLNNFINAYNIHVNNDNRHVSSNQRAAMDASPTASAINRFATLSDVTGLGAGDMTKAVYDSNNDGVVDKAYAIMSGTTQKTWSSILSQIASSIATHADNASAHHTRYTNAEAIGAINTDSDHDITAYHSYTNLRNKPAADAFTSGEVSNVRSNKLANGTTPWAGAVTLNASGVIPHNYLPVERCSASWRDATNNIATQAYFSSTNPGSVWNSFTGPAMLYGGAGYVTTEYGYLQYSTNNGGTWNTCLTSPSMMRAPSSHGSNICVWTCPLMYIPAGVVFIIRAGSTFGPGSSQDTYGGGYHIRYRMF